MNSPNSLLKTSGMVRTLRKLDLISDSQIAMVEGSLSDKPRPVVNALVDLRVIDELSIAQAMAKAYGCPLFNLEALSTNTPPDESLDMKQVQALNVWPLYRRGQTLFVATADPSDLQTLQQVKFHARLSAEPIVVEATKLERLIQRTARFGRAQMDTEFAEAEAKNTDATSDSSTDVDDAPVVRYVQKLLTDAVTQGASDLHFEPYEKFYRVRFRMDGVLHEIAQPPVSTKEKIAARLKIMARLDIAERRVPQDGRMRMSLGEGRFIDFRVSTLPTLFGEKIVMRILDPSSAQLGIEALGYEPDQEKALKEAIARPEGMILVTGPTGSGKTVSLYTCLNILNGPGVNISTAEDPAEINLPGINQVNINDKAGLNFATALKAFLRQDPDVIMVGEIRDLETADIAIKASQTGHLVLSTLHTNDAASTIVRLMNIGVAPFNIASSVILITAQRLVRKLCPHCKERGEYPEQALRAVGFESEELASGWTPFRAVGCDRCNGTGYKGRTGIYEVMPITETVQQMILRSASANDIRNHARANGVIGLREAALIKVRAGITSLEEVIGATH